MYSDMSVIGTILVMIAAIMLVAVLVTVHLALRKQDEEIMTKLTAENKMLRQENEELVGREKTLDRRSEWYHAIFANTEDMLFVHGLSDDMVPGPFVDVNDSTCERLKYTTKELLKMTPMDIGYDESTASILGFNASDMVIMSDKAVRDKQKKISMRPMQNLMRMIVENEETVYERTYVAKDRSEFPVEVKARSFVSEGKTYIICTAHDITQRKEVAQALKESEIRFRNFFDQSPIGIAIYDANKELVNVNLAFLRMFGVPDREQFKRVDVFKLSFIPEHMREKVRLGENIRVTLDMDFDVAREKSMFISSRTGTGHFDLMVNNMGRDNNLKARGYLVQMQDNTQRCNAEIALRDSEGQLRQAEKMEAIGSMAGGIAHDFNNILTPILGYTELTLRMVKEDNPMFNFMQEIMKAGHRAKDLVNQILTFSRQKDKDGHPVRIIPIVKEVLTLIRAAIPEEVEIKRIIKTEHDIVMSDPTQIHQVLMNLCTNAWHAMKESGGGVLEVRVTDFMHEKGTKSRLAELDSGRYIQISVCDTGVGMKDSVLQKIFEPFFTTKKSGEGTGMGLSVVRNIVTSFKGKILVDTELGKGSEFHVVLPTIEDSTMEEMNKASAPLKTGTETVLLVDDDPSILEMVARMLETLGYQPVTAKLGSEALELVRSDPARYDVVMTDQVMPGMLGNELAAEIFAISPDIPIVLCTGFSESFSVENAHAVGITAFLKKPIIMRDLADVIRTSIESKKA